jgi:WD40 repeat protein/uncharacterized caspase-like protein
LIVVERSALWVLGQDTKPTNPPAQSDRPQLVVQVGHANVIYAVAFSLDGSYMLTGSADKTVRVWETSTGKEMFCLEGHTGGVSSIACSPDGRQIYTGGDGTVRVWDAATAKELRRFDGIGKFVLSPDGKQILAGSNRSVRVLDTGLGEERKQIKLAWLGREEEKSIGVESLALSPDGKTLAVACVVVRDQVRYVDETSKIVWLVDVASGNLLHTLKGHPSLVSVIAFSPDSRTVLTCSNSSARLWEVATGKELRKLDGHTNSVRTAAFSPDGKTVLTGGEDLTVRIWDATTGQSISRLSHGTWVTAVACSPDGKYVLTGSYDNIARVWDATTGKKVRQLGPSTVGITSFVLARDGKHLLVGAADGTARIWDLSVGKELRRLVGHTAWVSSVAWAPDGKSVVTGSWDGTARIWDVITGRETRRLEGHEGKIRAIAFAPNGKVVITGSEDSTTRLWDVASGKEVGGIRGTGKIVSAVAFSSDGRRLGIGRYGAFYNNENTARVYDGITGQEQRQLDVTDVTCAIAFSDDGKRVATGCSSDCAEIWEAATGKHLAILKGHTADIEAVAFSPDGKILFTGSEDDTARLWDAATGREIRCLRGHSGGVNSVAFAREGKALLTGSMDSTVRLWDAATGREMGRFVNARDGLLVVTPDNYFMASRGALPAVAFRVGNRVVASEQFDLKFNRPDLVLDQLGFTSREVVSAYRQAYQKRLKRVGFTEDQLGDDYRLPEVTVDRRNTPLIVKEREVKLKVRASDAHGLLNRLNVYVNGVPIGTADGIGLSGMNLNVWQQEIAVELSAGKNTIQISAMNDRGVESRKETLEIVGPASATKPDLYVVAVGVSDYQDKNYTLTYADKDAKDLANFLESKKDSFGQVKVVKLLNGEAVRENILRSRDTLGQAQVDDLVIVFFAGHGMLDAKLDYYFATADIDFRDPARRGLRYEEIEGMLDGLRARRKLLMMDTCHSGEVDREDVKQAGPRTTAEGQIRSEAVRGVDVRKARLGVRPSAELLQELFADLRKGTGTVVIAAAGGLHHALESKEWQNGVFTYALLQGLKTYRTDKNKDGLVQVAELRDYVLEEVARLTEGRQMPANRRENLEFDFHLCPAIPHPPEKDPGPKPPPLLNPPG